MISIFSGISTPAQLLTNGIGALDAVFCNPRETINGEYCVDISIPVGSVRSEYFKFGAIIRCSTPRGDDYFRLDVPTVTLDSLTAVGWHISNDLGAPKIINLMLQSSVASNALNGLLNSCPEENRFSGTSDIFTIKNMYPSHVSPQAAIMDVSSGSCFLNIWGGEVERNKFTFNVKSRLGSDKGYRIELGKNLLGVTETPSGNGYTNRIIPRCRYAAMDSSELSGVKAAIDAKKTANIAIANNEKAIAYSIYAQTYDAAITAADAKRDASIAAADAQFLVDADAAKRDASKATANSLYDQESILASVNLENNQVAADTQCANAIAQAEQYAVEAKAAADVRFSDLADARKADIYLPEIYIDSPIPNNWDGLKHTSHVLCETVNVGEKNLDTGAVRYPTVESAYAAMRAIVAEMYANGADIPGVTIEIQFADLAQTEEYRNILALNTLDIQLGDTVHCRYHDRDISKRVVSYIWDSIGEKYLSITLGEVALNLAKSMRAQESSGYRLDSEMRGAVKQGVSYAGANVSATNGFTSTATVGGKTVTVNMSASGGGLSIMVNGVLVGGIILINGEPTLVSGALTNDPTDPECWARIGQSGANQGIFIFSKTFSATVPALKVLVGSGGDFYLQNSDGVNILDYQGDGLATIIRDFAGNIRFKSNSDVTSMLQANGDELYISAGHVYAKLGGTVHLII